MVGDARHGFLQHWILLPTPVRGEFQGSYHRSRWCHAAFLALLGGREGAVVVIEAVDDSRAGWYGCEVEEVAVEGVEGVEG